MIDDVRATILENREKEEEPTCQMTSDLLTSVHISCYDDDWARVNVIDRFWKCFRKVLAG